MKPDELLKAATAMIKGRIGPKEAAALAAIASCDGRAQTKDVAEIANCSREAASYMCQILKRKSLVTTVENPSGWPFYRLTSTAKKIINETAQ